MDTLIAADLIRALVLAMLTEAGITDEDRFDLLDIEERVNAIEARWVPHEILLP